MLHHTLARCYVFVVACVLLGGVVTGLWMRAELATQAVETSVDLYTRVFWTHSMLLTHAIAWQAIAAIFGLRMLPTLLGLDTLVGARLGVVALVLSALGSAAVALFSTPLGAWAGWPWLMRAGLAASGLGSVALASCLLATCYVGRLRLLGSPLALALALLGLVLALGGALTVARMLGFGESCRSLRSGSSSAASRWSVRRSRANAHHARSCSRRLPSRSSA